MREVQGVYTVYEYVRIVTTTTCSLCSVYCSMYIFVVVNVEINRGLFPPNEAESGLLTDSADSSHS
jgi:hypothetical protein